MSGCPGCPEKKKKKKHEKKLDWWLGFLTKNSHILGPESNFTPLVVLLFYAKSSLVALLSKHFRYSTVLVLCTRRSHPLGAVTVTVTVTVTTVTPCVTVV
jgi:hypothetical protein